MIGAAIMSQRLHNGADGSTLSCNNSTPHASLPTRLLNKGNKMSLSSRLLLGLALVSTASLAHADDGAKPPRRYRVTLGAGVVPKFPGAGKDRVTPLFDVSTARGDKPFRFSAPDDGGAFSLVKGDTFQIGPVVDYKGKRKVSDSNGLLPEVKATIEAGGFVAVMPTPSIRLRLDVRKGLNGHKGVIGVAGMHYIARDADLWLFSIGPRLTWSNARYQRAYFGVPAGNTLPAYNPGSGLQAVGGTTTVRRAL